MTAKPALAAALALFLATPASAATVTATAQLAGPGGAPAGTFSFTFDPERPEVSMIPSVLGLGTVFYLIDAISVTFDLLALGPEFAPLAAFDLSFDETNQITTFVLDSPTPAAGRGFIPVSNDVFPINAAIFTSEGPSPEELADVGSFELNLLRDVGLGTRVALSLSGGRFLIAARTPDPADPEEVLLLFAEGHFGDFTSIDAIFFPGPDAPVSAVPAPPALLGMLTALAGLGALRRQRLLQGAAKV